MEKMDVLLLSKDDYTGYEAERPCKFSFCNRLADCKFEQTFPTCMCKDHLHEYFYKSLNNYYSKYDSTKNLVDKNNFYLLIRPNHGDYKPYINSVKLLNKLEALLGWKESNYSPCRITLKYSCSSLIVYLNKNWTEVPYLFHFVMYLMRGGVLYKDTDPMEFLLSAKNTDLYTIGGQFNQKMKPLFEEGFVFNSAWSSDNYKTAGYCGYSYIFDNRSNKKEIKKYDKEKEIFRFKDWYSLELIPTTD